MAGVNLFRRKVLLEYWLMAGSEKDETPVQNAVFMCDGRFMLL